MRNPIFAYGLIFSAILKEVAASTTQRSRRPLPGLWNKTAFGDVYPKKNCPPDRFQSGGQSEKRVAMEANGVPASVLYPCPVQGVNTRFFLGGR